MEQVCVEGRDHSLTELELVQAVGLTRSMAWP